MTDVVFIALIKKYKQHFKFILIIFNNNSVLYKKLKKYLMNKQNFKFS